MAKEKKKKKKNRQSESVNGSERFVGRPNGYLDAETTAEMREWNDDFLRRYGIRIGATPTAEHTPVALKTA